MRSVLVHSFVSLSLCLAASTNHSVTRHASNVEASAAFMVVSGISAAEEYCLSIENGALRIFTLDLVFCLADRSAHLFVRLQAMLVLTELAWFCKNAPMPLLLGMAETYLLSNQEDSY